VIQKLFAQQVTFQHRYYNKYNSYINDFILTSDSGFIAVGQCDSTIFGSKMAMVFKCDRFGTVQWSVNLTDSTTWSDTYAINIINLYNGDFLISLIINHASGSLGCLVRMDINGQVVWSKILTNNFIITSMHESSKGELVFLCIKNNNFMLAKTDSVLQPLWTRSWSVDPLYAVVKNMMELAPDGIFYALQFTDYVNYDYSVIIKSNDVGTSQWIKWTDNLLFPKKIMPLPDSGCQMLFSSSLLQLSKTGDSVSNIYFYCLGGNHFGGSDFKRTIDNGYVVAGHSKNGPGIFNYSMAIMKLDSAAHPLWVKKYTGIRATPYHIFETSDDGLMIAGNDVDGSPNPVHGFVIKTNSTGSTFCNDSIMTALDSIGPFTLFGGPSTPLLPSSDTVTFISQSLKIIPGISDSIFCITSTEIPPVSNHLDIVKAYPNPARDIINIYFSLDKKSVATIDIYDFLGNRVFSSEESTILLPGEHHFTYSTSEFSNGIYLVNLIVNGQSRTLKFIKVD